MFVEGEMLIYRNDKQFLGSSFLKSNFNIGKYLISFGFSKVHDFTFIRINIHAIDIEPVFYLFFEPSIGPCDTPL